MSDENKKYVPELVFLVCDKGTIPTQLICDPQEINIYGVRFADENDNKPLMNIPSFGACKVAGTCEPPPGLKWTKLKEDVTLHGFKPLLEDSECICPKGGIIKIFFDKYAAELAAENNSESDFVKEPISNMVLGLLGSGLLGMISPDYRDGVGRGLKKGAEGTWNLLKDIWNKPGETLGGMARGLGNLAVIGAAYSTPMGALTGDTTLQAVDGLFGTSFRETKNNMVNGVSDAASHSWENVRRGNWGEVGEDVGQIQYAVVEAVVGTKGAGLALKGAKTGAQVGLNATRGLIGAQRLAQIGAKSAQVLNRVKFGVSGIVRTGRGTFFRNGWSRKKILDLPKGSRPKPSAYLDESFINKHLSKFDEGGGYITSKGGLDKFGREMVGRPDGQFLMPKSELDAVLKRANGDISVIERELGIPPGSWKGQELVRIDVPKPKDLNLRVPSGNEAGANDLWLPGGKLPTGQSEAVVNQIPKGSYTETPIPIRK